MYRKKNVLAARVELLQVSEVAGDFETATPLTFNRYTAYLQQLYSLKFQHHMSKKLCSADIVYVGWGWALGLEREKSIYKCAVPSD